MVVFVGSVLWYQGYSSIKNKLDNSTWIAVDMANATNTSNSATISIRSGECTILYNFTQPEAACSDVFPCVWTSKCNVMFGPDNGIVLYIKQLGEKRVNRKGIVGNDTIRWENTSVIWQRIR